MNSAYGNTEAVFCSAPKPLGTGTQALQQTSHTNYTTNNWNRRPQVSTLASCRIFALLSLNGFPLARTILPLWVCYWAGLYPLRIFSNDYKLYATRVERAVRPLCSEYMCRLVYSYMKRRLRHEERIQPHCLRSCRDYDAFKTSSQGQ